MKYSRMVLSTIVLSLVTLTANAQTVADYYDMSKVTGSDQIVCGFVVVGEVQPRCFTGVAFSRTLTPANDPTGKLAEKAMSDGQGVFTSVEVRELMIELDESLLLRGETNPSAPRMVLAKLFWQGRTLAAPDTTISSQDAVIGEIFRNASGELEFKVVEIPTQMSALGFLYPKLETAQIFGGDSNSEAVKQNLLEWTQAVLAAVLPDAVRASPYAPQVPVRP